MTMSNRLQTKTVQKVLAKYADRIERDRDGEFDVWDEGRDGVWLSLKDGWVSDLGTLTIHADECPLWQLSTAAHVARELREALSGCEKDDDAEHVLSGSI